MSDAPMPRRRAAQRPRRLLALPWVGLAGVGLALAAGVPFARLSVLAADLATAGVAVLATIAIERRKRARARQQRRAAPPRGVRLTAPLWVRADFGTIALAIGGTLAAVPATFGLSAVSLGVLLTFVVIGVCTMLVGADVPRALTFEDQGLRADYRKRSVLVAWGAIRAVRLQGPDHFTLVFLDVVDRETMMMMPWTAGLDGVALGRAIERGRADGAPALN